MIVDCYLMMERNKTHEGLIVENEVQAYDLMYLGQKGRIESQRRRVHREIVKDVYQGKNAEAKRKIISWNRAHPDQPLLQPNAEEILSYVYKQRQKKENP